MELDILQITRHPDLQFRTGLNEETVQAYTDVFKDSDHWWPFPAVVVFHDGNNYYLADGWHRLAAKERAANGSTVLADVRDGNLRAAELYAAGANGTHGLTMTNEEKRRAVERFLTDGEWGQWSDREIARVLHVSNTYVSNVKKKMVEDGRLTVNVDSKNYTRNGKQQTMKVEKIGKGKTAVPVPNNEQRRAMYLRQAELKIQPIRDYLETCDYLTPDDDQVRTEQVLIDWLAGNKDDYDVAAMLKLLNKMTNDDIGDALYKYPDRYHGDAVINVRRWLNQQISKAKTVTAVAPTPAPPAMPYPKHCPRSSCRVDFKDHPPKLLSDGVWQCTYCLRKLDASGRVPKEEPAPKPMKNYDQVAYEWLKAYKDDKARTWRDLNDNQTWHGSSPCWQSFAKQHPDIPKDHLKAARELLLWEDENEEAALYAEDDQPTAVAPVTVNVHSEPLPVLPVSKYRPATPGLFLTKAFPAHCPAGMAAVICGVNCAHCEHYKTTSRSTAQCEHPDNLPAAPQGYAPPPMLPDLRNHDNHVRDMLEAIRDMPPTEIQRMAEYVQNIGIDEPQTVARFWYTVGKLLTQWAVWSRAAQEGNENR